LELGNSGQSAMPGPTVSRARKLRESLSGLLFPAPGFGRVHHFSEESPLARLNARQAGIGTLLISGARSTAWEGTDLITGAEDVNGNRAGTTIYTRGNRPLVAFHEGNVAVTLRHVAHLRRAIFIASDAPLIVGLFDEAAAVVQPANSNGERAVVYLARIGELLELRAEYIAEASDQDLWATFGFRMTTPLNESPARR
jgi:hypothetical protein